MHIGFITPEYPHALYKGAIGGIGSFTAQMAKNLTVAGIKVSVFVYSQPKMLYFVDEGVEVYFVKKKTLKGFTWAINRRTFNKFVNKIVLDQQIDLLEAPEWTGFTAFMKFCCPLVLRLHGSDTYFCHLENRKVKAVNQFFEVKALKSANCIVGVSDFVAQKTKEIFGLKQDIQVIHNGIDSTKFVANHQQIKPFSILYFGTLVRKKGVLEIAGIFNEVIKQFPTSTLTCLGKDNVDVFTKRSTLALLKSELSKEAKLNFNYLPAVPYHQVQQHIKNANVILLPSFAEALPMTWLEAMALEKKMITSNIGWAQEIMIDGETGFMIYPTNWSEAAKKIGNLFADESNYYGVNARKQVISQFSQEKLVLKNIQLYKSLL